MAKKRQTADSLPLFARVPRKAIPVGCKSAWWYAETSGDITLYGHTYDGKPFSATIKARSLKVLRRIDTTGAKK